MYLSYEQITATDTVKTTTSLTIPANATHAMMMADTQNVRYTMDDTTDPTQTSGMVLVVGLPPEQFGVEDLLRIRFCRGAGTNGVLNIHYFGPREIT